MKELMIRVPLAVLRARRKVSQQEVARYSGLTQKSISNLETGKTRSLDFDTIGKLCAFFDITPGELFEVEEVRPAGRPISELGWSKEEAAESRARLASIEADWDAPGMEAYDDL